MHMGRYERGKREREIYTYTGGIANARRCGALGLSRRRRELNNKVFFSFSWKGGAYVRRNDDSAREFYV